MKMLISFGNGKTQEKNVRHASGAELLVQSMIGWTSNNGVRTAELFDMKGSLIAQWIKGDGNPQCMTLKESTRTYRDMH